LACRSVEVCPSEQPGAVGEGVRGVDLPSLGGEPQGSRGYSDGGRGFVQIEPWLEAILRRVMDGDLVVGAQRGDALAAPSVAVAGPEPVAIEDAGNDIVLHDECEAAHGLDDVGRCAVALPPSAAWQPMLGVGTTRPMDEDDDLGGAFVEVGDGLVDHGPDNALLQPRVGRRRRPDRLEVLGQGGKGDRRGSVPRRCGSIVLDDALLDLRDPRQRAVPACFQLASDEAILGIGGVILPERAIGGIARRLEVACQGLSRLVAPGGGLRLGRLRGLQGSWPDEASSAVSTASSTRRPPKAMQLGSP